MTIAATVMAAPPAERRQQAAWYLTVAVVLLAGVWFLSDLNWRLVWDASPLLLKGLSLSCTLTLVSVVAGMVLGIVLAMARLSRFAPLRYLSLAFTETVRATPQLMVIFWIYFSYPAIFGHAMDAWTGGAVALTLIAGAYLAEVIRGGLLSIPAVQRESATLLGLSPLRIFVFVLLPQACRNMLPAFIATIIMMFKTTSLVYVIGLIDFFRAIMVLNNREFAPLTLYTVMALVYFACCFALSSLMRFIDPKYTVTT